MSRNNGVSSGLLIYFRACYTCTWDCSRAMSPLGQGTEGKGAPSSQFDHGGTRMEGMEPWSWWIWDRNPTPHPCVPLLPDAASLGPRGGHSCLAQGERGALFMG